jgi:hypothetical protein
MPGWSGYHGRRGPGGYNNITEYPLWGHKAVVVSSFNFRIHLEHIARRFDALRPPIDVISWQLRFMAGTPGIARYFPNNLKINRFSFPWIFFSLAMITQVLSGTFLETVLGCYSKGWWRAIIWAFGDDRICGGKLGSWHPVRGAKYQCRVGERNESMEAVDKSNHHQEHRRK